MLTRASLLAMVAAALLVVPCPSDSTEAATCRAPLVADGAGVRAQPMIEDLPVTGLSPAESLRHYDVVFLGEVVVPSRKCSLGYCAGIRLVKPIKGQAQANNLIQVTRPGETDCGPAYFAEKGSRWVVFANLGTSRTGTSYVYAEDEGPSFRAASVPDFAALELRYRQMRARLDAAIDERLGTVRLR